MTNIISLGSTSIFVLGKENVKLAITQSATDKTNPIAGYRIEARLYDFTVTGVGTNNFGKTSINIQYSEDNAILKNFTVANGAETTFTTPDSFFSGLSSDKIVKFFIYPRTRVNEKTEEEGAPISSYPYLGIYTKQPELELQQIVWNENTPEATIEVKHPGFGYTKFKDSSAELEKNYRNALYDVLQGLKIGGEANGKSISLDRKVLGDSGAQEWYNSDTGIIYSLSFTDGSFFSNNLSYQITIDISFADEKKAWADPYTLQSNYFLSARISNFVISHNGAAMNIPKDLVPGLTSGLAVSTKANDNNSANSLALYDLFLDGTTYRNQPSISFRQIGASDEEAARIYVEGGNLKIKIGNRTITFTATGDANTTI